MEHLSLEIFDLTGTGSKYAMLPEDASITITDTSEVFASGDVWSYSFALNVKANAHIFGSAGDMHGARLHEQLNRRKARLWVERTPLYTGYLILGDEVDVDEDGNVDVGFESGQKTFEDMVEGGKANQVPMIGDVLIGMALWRKRWSSCSLKMQAAAILENGLTTRWGDIYYATHPHSGTIGTSVPFTGDGEQEGQAVQEYPRMVFPKLDASQVEDLSGEAFPGIDCLNTDYPYDDAHPYCNVALCYQKYGYQKKDKSGNYYNDYSGEPEAQRGYEFMPADRVNSAPNFSVIYWLKALMKYLGIHIEENQMMDVEDLRRLFFVNTNCDYKEPKAMRTDTTAGVYGKYRFASGTHLIPEFYGHPVITDFHGQPVVTYKRNYAINTEESGFVCTDFNATRISGGDLAKPVVKVLVRVVEVDEWESHDAQRYRQNNSYLHMAYATPECFPDADISEVISALESGFGIRLLFSDNYRRVRIVLLRNLFRDRTIQDVACDIVSETKQENAIRGFKMTYGSEGSDTTFYYKGFADMLPHKIEKWPDTSDKHDYSHWDLDADYAGLINKVSAFDKTCYVTPNTGNAFGIKIDKDAKRYEELHPSLFEYAGYMDAEDGDCTGEDDTIETVSVGFAPAIMNDLNMQEERKGSREQRFALFLDDTMRPRRPDLSGKDSPYNASDAEYDVNGVLYNGISIRTGIVDITKYVFEGMMSDDGIVKPGEFTVRSDMFASMDGKQLEADVLLGDVAVMGEYNLKMDIDGHVNEGYTLYLQDNYEPSDEGVSPIEKHDWGLMLGIMRGSGGDAYVDYSPDPDDKEGNDTWERVAGSNVTAHPDTCDCYGEEWDYNGEQEGIGPDGRVSLKLRAEKPNPYFDPKKPEGSDNRRYLEITKDSLKGRGLADQFYKEYSYWVRNARIAKMTVRMELSQLLLIDKTKKVRVGDVTGFIKKMQYTVSNSTGLGMVTMEIMYI